MYMYTVFSINTHREHLGDASLASPEHLSAAIDELVAYCEAQQAAGDIHDQAVVGVHCEVYEGAVRNRHGWKPLSGEPGRPVSDLTGLELV
jgi:hypothetical protein